MKFHSSILNIVRLIYFIIVLVNVAGLQLHQRPEILLRDHGYSGIQIAIGEDIAEDDNIITGIQQYFTAASRDLYTATRNLTSFRNITIIVPHSWNKKYPVPSRENFETAHIIIAKPNPFYRNAPYVKQIMGCGKPGVYMHLTPKYLTDRTFATEKWGSIGKTLVHEWAHLRWGVFNEYSDIFKTDPTFYRDSSNNLQAVRCSRSISGQLKGKCDLDPDTALPKSECIFHPNSSTVAKASIMSYHHLPSVDTFCDRDGSDPLNTHNEDAPTVHNRLCQGLSVWEVMRQHDDFARGSKTAPEGFDTTPTFTIVQQETRSLFLLLDMSVAMNEEGKMDKLRRSVAYYINHVIATGTVVSVISYADAFKELDIFQPINSDQDRDQLADKIPNHYSQSPYSCVGCALQRAYQLLEQAGRLSSGIIQVFSGGPENAESMKPSLNSIRDTIINSGVTVDTILFTSSADARLVELSRRTGGFAFFDSDIGTGTTLGSVLTELNNKRQGSTEKSPVQLYADTIHLLGKKAANLTIHIDSSVGRDTVFTFSFNGTTSPQYEIILKSPTGTKYTPVTHNNFKMVNAKIPGIAQSGAWSCIVRSIIAEPQVVEIIVTSKPTNQSAGTIRVASELSNTNVILTEPGNLKMVITAQVTRRLAPVSGAKVFAVIETAGGPATAHTQQLFDNGAGADIFKDDGIYSGYFLQFVGNGKYSVRILVNNYNGQAKEILGPMSSAFQRSSLNEDPVTLRTNTLENFQRTTSTGFFTVSNYGAQLNVSSILPPSPIMDLSVVKINYHNQSVLLTWTAVGEDFDQGRASKYHIKYARSAKDIKDDFENAFKVSQDKTSNGRLDFPSSSGVTEEFWIHIPFNTTITPSKSLAFAIQVEDAFQLLSNLSNIVPVSFVYVSAMPSTIEPVKSSFASETKSNIAETTQPSTSHGVTEFVPPLMWYEKPEILIPVIVGPAMVLTIVILITVCLCRHRKGKETETKNDFEPAQAHLYYLGDVPEDAEKNIIKPKKVPKGYYADSVYAQFVRDNSPNNTAAHKQDENKQNMVDLSAKQLYQNVHNPALDTFSSLPRLDTKASTKTNIEPNIMSLPRKLPGHPLDSQYMTNTQLQQARESLKRRKTEREQHLQQPMTNIPEDGEYAGHIDSNETGGEMYQSRISVIMPTNMNSEHGQISEDPRKLYSTRPSTQSDAPKQNTNSRVMASPVLVRMRPKQNRTSGTRASGPYESTLPIHDPGNRPDSARISRSSFFEEIEREAGPPTPQSWAYSQSELPNFALTLGTAFAVKH